MKTGDMILQSEFVSRWAHGKRLAFMGDGDAISVCVAYLATRGILDTSPDQITVFDFDERIVNAVKRFAAAEGVSNLDAVLYNVVDGLPDVTQTYDHFYTNPPWGASNNGESVRLFMDRGFELLGYEGQGLVVIADDDELVWPRKVLHAAQTHGIEAGFYVSRMSPHLHSYHLDDAPDLKSCNLVFSSLPGNARETPSVPRSGSELEHFYGRDQIPQVRYVRDRGGSDPAETPHNYEFEMLER